MSVELLHNQVDDAQYDKLNQANWISDDTPLHDIANRTIDSFQRDIHNLPRDIQESGLQKLADFLSNLGDEFTTTDLDILFEVLSSDDSIEKRSLPNGLPMFGNDYYGGSKRLEMIMSDIEVGQDMHEVLPFIFQEIQYTKGGKGYDMMTPDRQDELTKATKIFYMNLMAKSGMSYAEMEGYMIYGPTLLKDMGSEKVQDYFSNPENKRNRLGTFETQEEQLYFLRLWDFMNSSSEDQREVMADDSSFANKLRLTGVVKFMDNIEIPQFSQSPEVLTKKSKIFDILASECEGPELEQMVGVYQVYLEYIGDASQDIDGYMHKLQLFEDMLLDEFVGSWDIGGFIERLTSTVCKVCRLDKTVKLIGELRRMKSYIEKNALEAALFTASFCPYAGDCLDIGYGAYKLHTGKNFSGKIIHSGDAMTQLGFGCAGLGLNTFMPGSGSVVKSMKLFAKNAPELQIITKIGEKIQKLIPEIAQILEKCKDNMLSGLKLLKDLFIGKIYPSIKSELQQIIALSK